MNLLIDILAFNSIISAILVITTSNPVVSVLYLICVFVNIAGYLVLIGVGFIGLSYLIVYVGAVSILFLFVLMMLNTQLSEITAVSSEYSQNLPLGGVLGSIVFYQIVTMLPSYSANINNISLGILTSINNTVTNTYSNIASIYQAFTPSLDQSSFELIQIQSIGEILYTNQSIYLVIISFVLLLAIVGPITLTKLPLHPHLSLLIYYRYLY